MRYNYEVSKYIGINNIFVIFSIEVKNINERALPVDVNIAVNSAFAGCIMCKTGVEECQRVIKGNEVHIYYGKRKACPDVE